MNISQAIHFGCKQIEQSASPEFDTQLLLCYVLECSTVTLHSRNDQLLTHQQQQQFEQLLRRRQKGIPIAHLTGRRGFWNLDLLVTQDTLIPRPDTELLVELTLTKIKPDMIIADLGTGSGAIALSLAQEQPAARILAMDFSRAALIVARENAIQHQSYNVSFWQGLWLDAVADNCLDIVVSNPPYIRENDPHLLQGDVRFEPISALSSGDDGLADIRIIVTQAQRCLKLSGWLLVEHGYDQAQQVQELFVQAGFKNIASYQDFGGNDRVVVGQHIEIHNER